jgi:hypothetical protein
VVDAHPLFHGMKARPSPAMGRSGNFVVLFLLLLLTFFLASETLFYGSKSIIFENGINHSNLKQFVAWKLFNFYDVAGINSKANYFQFFRSMLLFMGNGCVKKCPLIEPFLALSKECCVVGARRPWPRSPRNGSVNDVCAKTQVSFVDDFLNEFLCRQKIGRLAICFCVVGNLSIHQISCCYHHQH